MEERERERERERESHKGDKDAKESSRRIEKAFCLFEMERNDE